MKTIIKHKFFLNGSEITERPEKGIKCFKCKAILNETATIKIASLIVKKDDSLIINWNWFCGICFLKLEKLIKDL